MPQKPSATLIAEVGSVTTRVTLVDTVDGEARLIGQASVPSTTEPPYENAVIGILEAATQLSETTGRQLMRDGSLLMPQTAERDGVDAVIGVTSAGAPMGVVIAAVSSEVSARSALRASRALAWRPVTTARGSNARCRRCSAYGPIWWSSPAG
jgi:hypothetical protein